MQVAIRIIVLATGLFIGACTLVELNKVTLLELINSAVPYIQIT